MEVPNLARIYTEIKKLDITSDDALPQYRLLGRALGQQDGLVHIQAVSHIEA